MTWLYGLLIGVAMGALIQRVGASSPRVILQNLRLENLTIIQPHQIVDAAKALKAGQV